MPASETVNLADLAPWLANLGAQAARVSWLRAMKAATVMLKADFKENFERGESPDGVPWLPLKRQRANSKGGDLPLRDTGVLMASATAQGPGHVENITDTSLEFGTNLDKAQILNDGGTVRFPERTRKPPLPPWVFPGKGGRPVFTRKIKEHTVAIPARPFVGLSERFLRRLDALLADEAQRQLGFDPRGLSSSPP